MTATGASAASKSFRKQALTPMRRAVLADFQSGSEVGLSLNMVL